MTFVAIKSPKCWAQTLLILKRPESLSSFVDSVHTTCYIFFCAGHSPSFHREQSPNISPKLKFMLFPMFSTPRWNMLELITGGDFKDPEISRLSTTRRQWKQKLFAPRKMPRAQLRSIMFFSFSFSLPLPPSHRSTAASLLPGLPAAADPRSCRKTTKALSTVQALVQNG